MRLATLEQWRQAVSSDPTATFFQTPAWHQVSSSFCDSKPWPLLWEWKGRSALLPLSRRHRPPLACFFSPHGTYTAPLSVAPLESPALQALNRDLERHSFEWTGNPYSHNSLRFENPLHLASHAFDLDIPGALSPEKWGSKDMRRRYRRANEAGIVARKADCDSDWEDYYRIYRATLDRWGSKTRRTYSLAWFQSMKNHLADHPGFEMWLACRPGIGSHTCVLAGLIVLRQGKIASGWQLVSGINQTDKVGISVVLHAALRSAQSWGCRFFDLGPSPNLPDVARFKSGIGATEYGYQGMRRSTLLYGLCASLRRAIA